MLFSVPLERITSRIMLSCLAANSLLEASALSTVCRQSVRLLTCTSAALSIHYVLLSDYHQFIEEPSSSQQFIEYTSPLGTCIFPWLFYHSCQLVDKLFASSDVTNSFLVDSRHLQAIEACFLSAFNLG